MFCRFHDPWFGKYFDGDPSTGQMQDFSPLPVLHIHLMRLWTAWLDNYPEDFVNNPVMAVSVLTVYIQCWTTDALKWKNTSLKSTSKVERVVTGPSSVFKRERFTVPH